MADIKVRVGQQNAIKVVSSVSGASGGNAINAENVIGGIASVTQISVSGVSTFVGVVTTGNDLYVGNDLYLPSGSIGIGTESPTSALWVNGDGYFTGVVTASNFYVGNTIIGTGGTFTNLDVSGSTTLQQVYVAGVSTFVGVVTTSSDLYVGGDLYISDDLIFDAFTANSGNITGILTVGQSLYYPIGEPYGIAYFDTNDQLVSTGTTAVAISETNYIVSTNSSGIPTWASTIDGGVY